MKIDITKTPFSRFGSYLAVSPAEEKQDDSSKPVLILRDLGGGDEDPGHLLKIVALDQSDNPVDCHIEAEETELRMAGGGTSGEVRCCFPDGKRARFFSSGMGFAFDFILGKYDHVNPLSDSRWELHSYLQEMKLLITLRAGNCRAELDWDTIGNRSARLVFSGDQVDITLERYVTVPRGGNAALEYEDDLTRVRADYAGFLAKVPSALDPADETSRRLAAYITWSAVVGPSGILKRPAMYMSNNWMTNLWSWDNCFNAISLGKNQPRLAFDQLAIFNDFQDESGVLPDFVNDRSVSYACCKPPVQGWAWARLMELNEFFHQTEPLKEMYGQLKGLHRFWSIYRTSEAFALPFYNHGNDSGWDNATVFARGCPVTSPDLPSYLVLLYETLEKMADLLGLPVEAKEWKTAGETMMEALLANLWDGDFFRSYVHSDKTFITEGDCLINFMPLVIGSGLPGEVRKKLVEGLKTRGFLTPYGLATESVESPFYRTDGYWRGPVWAPVMLLIIDGLRRGGEEDFARDLSRRFRSAARKGGMAENFDAKTGEGLVDPAFTWTSSVFLHLASEAFYHE